MNSLQLAEFETGIDAALQAGQHARAESLARSYLATAGEVTAGSAAQSPAFRAAYLSAQVFLAVGKLHRTLDVLQIWLPRCPELPSLLGQRVYLIAAEAAVRLNLTSKAQAYLELSQRAESGIPPLLMRLRAARIRLWLEQLAELNGTLIELYSELQSVGDAANHALLLTDEAMARDRAGDLEGAVACCLTALGLLGTGSTGQTVRSYALLQLGRFEHVRGNLQVSLDCFAAAQAAVERRSAGWLEAQLRRFLVRLDLNQWAQVIREFVDLQLNVNELPEELRGLCCTVATLVGLHVTGDVSAEGRAFGAAQQGDLGSAREFYRAAHASAQGDERRAKFAIALGSLAMAQADWRDASTWLAAAERIAREKQLPEALWRAYQLQGELAAQLSGQEEQARSYFERAVAVSERQVRQLKFRADAATYNTQRHSVLQQLLRLAAKRGDAERTFELQELTRGRLLWELCRSAGIDRYATLESPDLTAIDQQIKETEGEIEAVGAAPVAAMEQRYLELIQNRERLLEDCLRNRSRVAGALLPQIPALRELQAQLSPGELYLAPTLIGDDVCLLVARQQRAQSIWLSGCAVELRSVAEGFRKCVAWQLSEYVARTLGPRQRSEIDEALEALGNSRLGHLVRSEIGSSTERLFWSPDGELHGLPLAAFRTAGRYWINDLEIVNAFGGALLTHQLRQRRSRSWLPRKLLAVAESADVLPMAEIEARNVLHYFWRRCLLTSHTATRFKVAEELPRATLCHFACHAVFDEQHPLSAHIGLPSGESWRTVDWLAHSIGNLRLVTLSACRSANVSATVGNEVFGLVTSVLGAGVGSVLASFWPVADAETAPLMERFYDALRTCDPATALARVQRLQALDPASSPLFWGAWGLFGDPDALGKPSRWSIFIDQVLRPVFSAISPKRLDSPARSVV